MKALKSGFLSCSCASESAARNRYRVFHPSTSTTKTRGDTMEQSGRTEEARNDRGANRRRILRLRAVAMAVGVAGLLLAFAGCGSSSDDRSLNGDASFYEPPEPLPGASP